jgi:hypothetical protein
VWGPSRASIIKPHDARAPARVLVPKLIAPRCFSAPVPRFRAAGGGGASRTIRGDFSGEIDCGVTLITDRAHCRSYVSKWLPAMEETS